MSRFAIATTLALLGTTGCLPATGVEAPFDANLSIPDDVEISGAAVGTYDDNIGALILLDVLVFSDETGLPMDNIQVELLSNSAGVYLIPSSAVKLVGGPAEVSEDQCFDGDGNYLENAPDECYWLYDSSGDQYIQFASDFANVYKPNYMMGATDEHGILRSYVYVDAMPEDSDGQYTDAAVSVMLGHLTDTFTIASADNAR